MEKVMSQKTNENGWIIRKSGGCRCFKPGMWALAGGIASALMLGILA